MQYAREWRAAHPGYHREYSARYYQEHRDRLAPASNARVSAWQKAHRELCNARYRAWCEAHPEAARAISKRFYDAHSERWVGYASTRRARMAGNGGSHTVAEWRALVERFGHRCVACGAVGKRLERDHIVPITRGGTSDIANIQPLCLGCNRRKGRNIADHRPV